MKPQKEPQPKFSPKPTRNPHVSPPDMGHMKPELVRRYADMEVNPELYGCETISGVPEDIQLTDIEMISQALNMWANWIETGDVNLSANDAQATHRKVRPLGKDGMERVLRLRQLAENTSNYEQFKRGLMNAPMTYCPALLKTMVETCYTKHAFGPGQIHRFVKGIEIECELNQKTSQEPQKPGTSSLTSQTTQH